MGSHSKTIFTLPLIFFGVTYLKNLNFSTNLLAIDVLTFMIVWGLLYQRIHTRKTHFKHDDKTRY